MTDDDRHADLRAAKLLGLAAGVVVALLGAVFWVAANAGHVQHAAAAAVTSAATPTDTPLARTPSETFTVHAPKYTTPRLTASIGPETEPVLVGPSVEPEFITDGPTASGSVPPSAPRSAAAQNVRLLCEAFHNRVQATLTFESATPLPVALTAGDRTKAASADGRAALTLMGQLTNREGSCSANVSGQQVGPVPAVSIR